MKQRGTIIISSICIALLLAGAVFFFPKNGGDNLGGDLRMPVSGDVRIVGIEDLPPPIENAGRGLRVWSMRASATNAHLDGVFIAAIEFIRNAPNVLDRYFRGETVSDNWLLAEFGIQLAAAPASVIKGDGTLAARLFASTQEAQWEELDHAGLPLRWRTAKNFLAWKERKKDAQPNPENKMVAEKPKIVRYPRGAGHYRELVENFSRRYNLNTALVMAIIHSESDFSPSIVSPKSAMGLMQLLPSTASGEVHRFLYGRSGRVSFEQLSVPEINIRYGTAYLHILLNRYFQNVNDDRVREYCAIASYNLGPNRFLRLYGRTNEQAVERINSMGVEEFYADLTSRLPTRETRYYVEKVRRMKMRYQ